MLPADPTFSILLSRGQADTGRTEDVSEETTSCKMSWNKVMNYHRNQCQSHLTSTVRTTYFIHVVCRIRRPDLIQKTDEDLNFVSPRPLCITRMLIDPPDVLSHFGHNRVNQEVVQGVEGVGEDELRPRENAQLVANGIELIAASQLVRGLVGSSTPDAQLE